MFKPKMEKAQLRQLAERGAVARLEELTIERALIIKEFPGIVTATERERPTNVVNIERRGRRKMTAAQREAVGRRMRRYWASRRREKKAS